MAHLSTIKAAVKKQFPDVKVVSVTNYKFGVFSVKVSKDMPRSVKIGFIMGETDSDLDSKDMIKLENKIEWAGSI